MRTTPRAQLASRFCSVRIVLGALMCVFAIAQGSRAQNAEPLSRVKKIYVDSLGDGKGAAAMRERLADRLRASRKLHVVANGRDADAILKGTGRIWVTGYNSLSIHGSSGNRQPIFDGFLSADVEDKTGTTIWSYLVTPSKFSVKRITTDLADQLVQKLLEAIEQEGREAGSTAAKENPAVIALRGAGATFPWPIYQKWFEAYQQKSPEVRIGYDPVGSESGIQLLSHGEVDFAGSDMPLSDQAMADSKVRFVQFATVLGAVVPIYNLQSVKQFLNFTPEALAGIYLGTIKRWNDPLIQASNPGVSLPDSEIVVVHRSDGSGTTFVWTDYLAKVSPEWKQRVGAASARISWPLGRGAERNDGVAALVRRTLNSIGYVELIYAIQHELRYGAVRNGAGNFVKADLASVTAAAGGMGESGKTDFRVSITNAPGKDAYPISTFTWVLLPEEGERGPKRSAVVEFLRWALTSGQRQCASLGYAPLPAEVTNEELKALGGLK